MEPEALISGDRVTETLVKFVSLKHQDESAAINFVNEFGEFDYLEVKDDQFVGSGIPEIVQRHRKQCFDDKIRLPCLLTSFGPFETTLRN